MSTADVQPATAVPADEGASADGGTVSVDENGHGRIVFRHELLRKFGTVWESRAVNDSPCAGVRFSYFNNSKNAHNSNILQVILRDHGFHKTEPPDGDWNVFWCAGQVRAGCFPRPHHLQPPSVYPPQSPPSPLTMLAPRCPPPVGGSAVVARAQALPEGEQVPKGELSHAEGESLDQLLANADPLRPRGLWLYAADVRPPQPARDAGGAPPSTPALDGAPAPPPHPHPVLCAQEWMEAPENDEAVWIIKPAAAYCGKGINLYRNGQELPEEVKAAKGVACRYIDPPYLINGLKSDIRMYVLVSPASPRPATGCTRHCAVPCCPLLIRCR